MYKILGKMFVRLGLSTELLTLPLTGPLNSRHTATAYARPNLLTPTPYSLNTYTL